MNPYLAVVVAGLIGLGNTSIVGLATAAFIPMLWARAHRRSFAMATILAYYLVAARGIPPGSKIFFATEYAYVLGVLLWVSASFVLSVPWILLWSKHMDVKALLWRVPLVLLLLSVPPIGIVGWSNPVVAAGALLPGASWPGLIMVIIWMALMGAYPKEKGLYVLFVLSLAYASFVYQPKHLEEWAGVNTSYGGIASGKHDFTKTFGINMDLVHSSKAMKTSVVLYPETILGLWTPSLMELWKDQGNHLNRKNMTLFAGAEDPHGAQYDNVLVAVGHEQRITYRQRMPIPYSMWRPWTNTGARADFFGPGTFSHQGQRVGVLICYEQLLVWPVLASFAEGAQVLFAPANAWWGKHTSIPHIQLTAVTAWARLFDVPLIASFNS